MSLETSIEILIYLKDFKNIDLFQQGLYQIKVSMNPAQPYMKLDQIGIKSYKLEQSLIDADIYDTAFWTRQIWIKFEDELCTMREGCFFRLEKPTFKNDVELEILFELFYFDTKSRNASKLQINQSKKISEQRFKLKNLQNFLINYIPIDFTSQYSCLVNCLVVSCPLNIKYKQSAGKPNINEFLLQYQQKGLEGHVNGMTINHLILVTQQLFRAIKDIVSKYYENPSIFEEYFESFNNVNSIKNQILDFDCKLNKISQNLYQIWYKLIEIICKNQSKLIQEAKEKYMKESQKVYADFIVNAKIEQFADITIKSIKALRLLDQRILYQLSLSPYNILETFPVIVKQCMPNYKPIQIGKNHLIVYVHGYRGAPYDMRRWRNTIAEFFPQAITLLSVANEREGMQPIMQMGMKLSQEILKFIDEIGHVDQISFICHSIGGVVARAALTFLGRLRSKFNFLITLGTPHLGIVDQDSRLVKTGFWVLSSLMQTPSIIELAMEDTQDLVKCLIYQLSTTDCFSWFKQIVLVGSKQDEYVPWDIALLLESERIEQCGPIYKEMVRRLQCDNIIRLDVNFQQKGDKWDKFIGRMAHMSLVENVTMIKMIVLSLMS